MIGTLLTKTSKAPVARRAMLIAPLLATLAACGGRDDTRMDDALRNDLSLATQAQQYRPQQVVSPQELGYQGQPYGQQYVQTPYGLQPVQTGYAAGPYYAAAPQPQPTRVIERERVVYRRSGGGGGGGYSSAGVYRESRPTVKKNTKRDAVIGGVAGAAIGVATSARKDRLKGGIIGAVAGSAIGAVIGNNVDIQRRP